MNTSIKTVVSSFYFFCATLFCNHLSAQSIPNNWPGDATITISYGGGMRQFSEKTFISAGKSYYEQDNEGVVTRNEFTFTQVELDSLMQFMKKKNFDEIKSVDRGGVVDDMGTTSLTLSYGGKFYGGTVSGSLDIKSEQQRDNFMAVYHYILRLVGKKNS